MKVGDLVKYIGSASMYRDRVGIIATTYRLPFAHGSADSALVHFVGLEGKGRDATGVGQVQDGLHPMSFYELQVFTPEDTCL